MLENKHRFLIGRGSLFENDFMLISLQDLLKKKSSVTAKRKDGESP